MKITVTDPKAVPRVRDECELNRCIASVFLTLSVFTHIREGGDKLQRPILWTCHDFRKQHPICSAIHDRHRGTCNVMFSVTRSNFVAACRYELDRSPSG